MKSTCSRFHVLILVSMLVLAGCSGRQIYQSAAGWRQNECQKILEDAERARCMEQANKDYDTYSKERNASPEQR
jgi:hypothetical protein